MAATKSWCECDTCKQMFEYAEARRRKGCNCGGQLLALNTCPRCGALMTFEEYRDHTEECRRVFLAAPPAEVRYAV